MKVVYAIPFFEPAIQFGGPVVQAAAIAERMAAAGHRVQVVTTDLGVDDSWPRNCWIDRCGYRVWYGGAGPLNRRAPYYAPMLHAPLHEALREADVLHLHVGLTLLNVAAARAARRHGVPYVYSAQGCLCPHRLRMRRWSKWLFLRCFERRVLRGAAALQALHSKDVADLVRQGADRRRIEIIPNGVEIPANPRSDAAAFRRQYGIPLDALVMLFLGRLESVKGLDLLVDVWADVAAEFPQLQLIVAGPDEGYQAPLQRRVHDRGLADRLHLTGVVSGAARQAAFEAADLFVLTSYSEGLPLAVLEACARGLPALLTDRCNLPEVAAYGGGRVEPANRSGLSNALRGMLADPTALRLQGANARHLVQELFSLDSVVQRLESLYARLSTRRETASTGTASATGQAASPTATVPGESGLSPPDPCGHSNAGA